MRPAPAASTDSRVGSASPNATSASSRRGACCRRRRSGRPASPWRGPRPASASPWKGCRAKDTTITERGLFVEGAWPVPPGFSPVTWSDAWRFSREDGRILHPVPRGAPPADEQSPPDHDGRVREGHRPGEARKHKVVVEEIPHRTIEASAVRGVGHADPGALHHRTV